MTLDREQVEGWLQQMEREIKSLKEEAYRLSWSSRGGLSYNDAMLLSKVDKEIMGKVITDNLEITKKSRLPYF